MTSWTRAVRHFRLLVAICELLNHRLPFSSPNQDDEQGLPARPPD